MDTLRGNFESTDAVDDSDDWDAHEEQASRELPPEAIGQDERRMQVRAYNHWAELLGDRTYPSIEDLEPTNLPDFGPNSVLLDFSSGIEDPIVVYLGGLLGEECGAQGQIGRLSDVPPRSLLSRITDHYLQILANQAPIGFEAEFVNQRSATIAYRGILLPFSSDDETIDFIYGVINWKELADQATADELLLEIDQAIGAGEDDEDAVEEDEAHKHPIDPVTDWADSPVADLTGETDEDDNNVESLSPSFDAEPVHDDMPMPDFGHYDLDDPDGDDEYDEEEGGDANYSFASLTDYIEAPAKKAIDLESGEFDAADYGVDYSGESASEPAVPAEYSPSGDHQTFDEPVEPVEPTVEFEPDPAFEKAESENVEPAMPYTDETAHNVDQDDLGALPEDAGLYDCLASARELADAARTSEDRSRKALYAAVGRAYDFSLAAQDNPEDFSTLIEDSGLSVQDRAPMTPVVKLVFGVDYDKTRLTEYAAVLSHAHRIGIERGGLTDFLSEAEGGLKGVVSAERRLRKEENGEEVESENAVRRALAQKLRELEAMTLDALEKDGPEFGLVMIRRNADGVAEVIGEIDEDVPMIERAARKLLG